MKKGVIVCLSILLAFVFLSASFVSASWLGDFWNKITGDAVNTSEDCGFYNSIILGDELGDASQGSPGYVDIKSLEVRQIGQYVQFVWEANGELYNDDEQYYFIFFDTDNDIKTGQNCAERIGAEIKIFIDKDLGSVIYFDKSGNVLSQISNLPVIFYDNKFYISIEKSEIGYGHFNLYFESSGAGEYRDEGNLTAIDISSPVDDSGLIIKADNQLLDNPPLITIPQKNSVVQLNTYYTNKNSKLLVPSEEVTYFLSHQEKDSRIGELSSIISVDSKGVAKYLKEGYILVNALYKSCDVITNQPIIVATGDIFGSVSRDSVMGVFPKDYSPENNENTFGEMFSNYPNVIKMLNKAYTLTSQLYANYKPFKGAKQILSFEVSVDPNNPFDCYNGNPLTPSPSCYISLEGNPIYNLPIHEMGHNFGASDFGSEGMRQLLYQNNKINTAGFGECVASLPVIYIATDIYNNPEKYGINESDYEWTYYKNFLDMDVPGSQRTLENFESLISENVIESIFDNNGKFDGVSAFCSFFQQYSYDFIEGENLYKNEIISRFLGLFGDKELENFRQEEVETYFSAAFSAAVGNDLRNKLRYWGFTINDSYFDELYPVFLSQLENPINFKLVCEKAGVEYKKRWHISPCYASACGADNYVGCDEVFLGKLHREICRKSIVYETECSESPSCNGDRVVNQIPC